MVKLYKQKLFTCINQVKNVCTYQKYENLRTDSLYTNKREGETIKYSWRMFQNLITWCSSVGYMTHSTSCRNRTGLWNARMITWIYDDWKRTDKENIAAYFKVSPKEHSGLLTYILIYLLTYSLTYSMELSLSWEVNRFSASQEIPHILWNPMVH